MPIATHQIDMHGVSGGIFWMILLSLIFYVLGFATVGWQYYSGSWIGLWSTCSSRNHVYGGEGWFEATRAMITIGLILLVAACIAIFIYMFIHSGSVSKNTLIKVFTCLCFIAAIFMLIGVIIFGVEVKDHLNWSYAFAIIGLILCFIAGVLGVVQMKQSNVI